MGILTLWQRAHDIGREVGGAQLVASLVQKVALGVIQCGTVKFFTRDLTREVPSLERSAELQFRLAGVEDIPVLVRDGDPSQASEEMLRERFELGDFCFVVENPAGEFVHARWVTTGKGYVPELRMDIALRPGEAYMYGGYTSPRWRKAGIDGAVRAHVFRTMRGRGYSRIYSYVRGDNPRALRAASRLQTLAQAVWYLQLGPFRPLVFPQEGPNPPSLCRSRTSPRVERDRHGRMRQMRQWFEGWTDRPVESRSTGFRNLSEEEFRDTARYIVDVLQLEPARDDVLDVGCDSAMVSRGVALRCRRFTGVDVTAGMLAAIGNVSAANGSPARFAAADGRHLPFPPRSFDKVYSSAVIHMLPGTDDGLEVIREMLRVCRPGGVVLVASVPDRGKRFNGYIDRWKEVGVPGRARLLLSLVLPGILKRTFRRVSGIERTDPVALNYDVNRIAARIERLGYRCRVEDFPRNYWNPDFHRTRSNLLIELPGAGKDAAADSQKASTLRMSRTA